MNFRKKKKSAVPTIVNIMFFYMSNVCEEKYSDEICVNLCFENTIKPAVQAKTFKGLCHEM